MTKKTGGSGRSRPTVRLKGFYIAVRIEEAAE